MIAVVHNRQPCAVQWRRHPSGNVILLNELFWHIFTVGQLFILEDGSSYHHEGVEQTAREQPLCRL
jgi:hypothetical protein